MKEVPPGCHLRSSSYRQVEASTEAYCWHYNKVRRNSAEDLDPFREGGIKAATVDRCQRKSTAIMELWKKMEFAKTF